MKKVKKTDSKEITKSPGRTELKTQFAHEFSEELSRDGRMEMNYEKKPEMVITDTKEEGGCACKDETNDSDPKNLD